MKNRKLWCALVAALLCAALLCPALALAEDDALLINDTTDRPLDIELDEAFDDALPNLPGLDLMGDLALNDALTPDETGPITLGGDAASNAEDGSGETPSPKDVVTLVARYTGGRLTKIYDCNKYGAYMKDDQVVYVIEALKTIKEKFKLTPVKGKSLVKGHENVNFKLSLSKQFESADVGRYKFEFKVTLTGDDAAYYRLKNETVKVPAIITRREVIVTPRAGLSKVYGTADPKYPDGSWLSNDETSPLHQDISGVPGYGVPVNTVDGKLNLTVTEAAYLMQEARLKGTKFFPGDNPWLSRKKGEKVGKYRITLGGMNFGKNFKVKLKEEYFTITPKNLADANVIVKDIPNQKYTGKHITLNRKNLVVTYGNMTLKEGRDFTTRYENNIEVSPDSTTPSAKVTLIGKGNFTGTREAEFVIITNIAGTSFTKLKGVKNGVNMKWKKGVKVSGYEIEYSVFPDFYYSNYKVVNGINNTSLTLYGLDARTTYYARIRTYKISKGKTYWSAYSKVKKFTTK